MTRSSEEKILPKNSDFGNPTEIRKLEEIASNGLWYADTFSILRRNSVQKLKIKWPIYLEREQEKGPVVKNESVLQICGQKIKQLSTVSLRELSLFNKSTMRWRLLWY